MMSVSFDYTGSEPTRPAEPNHRETAILEALSGCATTKTAALGNAYAYLREVGRYTGQEELGWSWDDLVRTGRIVRVGRRWKVAA